MIYANILKVFSAIVLSCVLTAITVVVLSPVMAGAPSIWPFVVTCVVVAGIMNKVAGWLVGKVFQDPDGG